MDSLTYKVDLSDFKDFDFANVTPKAQKFFANNLLRVSEPYVPFGDGILAASGRVVDDGAAIEYDTPYARYHWYGKLMVDPITGKGAFFSENYGFWSRRDVKKKLTDVDLKYKGAPIRGSHWVMRAWNANKDSLMEQEQDFIVSEYNK